MSHWWHKEINLETKEYELGQLLTYEQPTPYIVSSTKYSDKYKTPVLTAGKSFIIGYTDEETGIYDRLPVIIFDDFTTSSKYVNFKFKVKSSAMKILTANTELVLPKYIFYRMQIINIDHSTHKRYWIQHYSKLKIQIPAVSVQEKIVQKIEELFSELDKSVETLQTIKQQLAVYRQAVLKEAFEEITQYVHFGSCIDSRLGKMLDKEKNTGSFRKYLRNINVRWFSFDISDLLEMKIENSEMDKYTISKGDLVICEGGEPGRCAVWTKDESICYQKALHRVRFTDGSNPYFYIGDIYGNVPITLGDALLTDPGYRVDYVLTNPPFGKKSSLTFTNEEGEQEEEDLVYNRQDFWTTSSNKQLNFVQHINTVLKATGKAAVVVPDNVLFEGGAGEIVRKKLLETTDLHTILRLPTGIFYKPGVKANVIFFDKRPASAEMQTREVWVYDFRTNIHFTLKQHPMTDADLADFVKCYNPENRYERSETWSEENPDGRWRRFDIKNILERDKTSLDLFWIKDKSLADLDNLPDPDELAVDIIENLQSALESFQELQAQLKK